ncbi:MAG: DUF1737 domain-containing protein [Pseudomonadota bacterium]|nr:DUF1737 domain-containing protein [Pseudomonadota bacterium]MEC8246684.1 DUF1737 domain-containing protein [Pseudomonadota bacterium]MEC8565990.1 DUF1737 domain-containing protein [Pseudomonadota bacterium]
MTGDEPKAYRFLTGDDDAAFCQRVSDALRDCYVLFGPPLLQLDAHGNRHCGQAVALPEFASSKSAVTGSEN